MQQLKDIIVGDEDPAEVVLIDIEPWKQNTQIDFHATRKVLGIKVAYIPTVTPFVLTFRTVYFLYSFCF